MDMLVILLLCHLLGVSFLSGFVVCDGIFVRKYGQSKKEFATDLIMAVAIICFWEIAIAIGLLIQIIDKIVEYKINKISQTHTCCDGEIAYAGTTNFDMHDLYRCGLCGWETSVKNDKLLQSFKCGGLVETPEYSKFKKSIWGWLYERF